MNIRETMLSMFNALDAVNKAAALTSESDGGARGYFVPGTAIDRLRQTLANVGPLVRGERRLIEQVPYACCGQYVISIMPGEGKDATHFSVDKSLMHDMMLFAGFLLEEPLVEDVRGGEVRHGSIRKGNLLVESFLCPF